MQMEMGGGWKYSSREEDKDVRWKKTLKSLNGS